MIIELFSDLTFALLNMIINLLPTGYDLPGWLSATTGLIAKATFFFPADLWMVCIGNIVFCNLALITWAIIEWVYKKIPGVQ